MTEKRFYISGIGISDRERKRLYDLKTVDGFISVRDLLNELSDENEQLKQRNENQYNQLNQLWQLIEAKDWETLTAMNNQMKEDEKQLQREMRCYK